MKVGTTVTWLNHDDIPHSIVCPALKVTSHPLDTDDSFAYKFEQAGTYDYLCGLHPHMHGQVVVGHKPCGLLTYLRVRSRSAAIRSAE